MSITYLCFVIYLNNNQSREMVQEFRKKYPYFFLIIISIIMIFIYFCVVKLLMLDMHPWPSAATTLFLILYHVVLVLLIWSLVQTIRSDPGRVPLQWGFGLSNPTRKYCLICHVYKPQRTHHCSSCSRCVLNMDHHCPWINSCIGFNNRKFFLLMLFYTILLTLINIIAYALSVSSILSNFTQNGAGYIINTIVVTIGIILNTIIFVTILLFFKFHLDLVFSNQTTLETLELKRQGKNPDELPSDYDLGKYYNWVQVFGRNSCMWFFPIFLSNEGPAGDGVIWPKRPTRESN